MSVNPVGTLSGWLGQQTPGVPGSGGYNVGGEGDAKGNPNVVPIPGSPGLFIDQSTGQVITAGPDGRPSNSVAQAPNASVLTTQNTAAGGVQQGVQQGALAGFNNNLAAENSAIARFNNTITNPNAPSVAGSQLATGFGNIVGQQTAQAAGATGENRGVANRTMAQNIVGAQTALNGQQAGLRAGEVATAENGAGALLGAEGNQLGNLYSTTGNDALGYSSLAAKNQGDIMGTNEKSNEANAKANAGLLSNLGGSAASLAALF